MGLTDTPKQIWCVMDGKPGHRSITTGMMQALASQFSIEATQVHLPRWTVPLGKLLQPLWPAGAALLKLARSRLPDRARRPDLILGSGGNSLWSTAALGRLMSCPSVFVGSNRHLPLNAISCFVHYDPVLERQGFLRLAVLPGPRGEVPPEALWTAFCAARNLPPRDRYLVCLVGGDGAGYQWRPDEGKRLAKCIEDACRACNARLLVTTSRRTSLELENALRDHLPPELIADACWSNAGDTRRVVATYLAGAHAVMVGEDSMSMIHEALASGRPVITLRPGQANPDDRYLGYLEFAEHSAWLARIELRAAVEWGKVFSAAGGYPGDVHAEAAKALGARLGWQLAPQEREAFP